MKVFISCSIKDKDFAMKLKDLIVESTGINNDSFSCDHSLSMRGVNQPLFKVFNAIANADIIIPLLSENYLSDRFCLLELGMICSFMYMNNKKIVPVYIYQINLEDLLSNTLFASNKSYDLSNPTEVKELLDKVAPDIIVADGKIEQFSYEIQEILVLHNAVYNYTKDVQACAYGTDLIVKNWSDYVTYHKSNDKNEIEVSYNLNPYELKNPKKPEFVSLVLKYYSSLDLYFFTKFSDNARIEFELDNSNNSLDKIDVEIKGPLGILIGKPASFEIKEGINDCKINLLNFMSKQLKEVDEICFVLRPEHSIKDKGEFVIKDLRVSIY